MLGVALAILVFVKARHTQRATPEGLAALAGAASTALEQNEVFPTAPPIAVALWERHLAYGAAFGIAPGAVRPMPMGSGAQHAGLELVRQPLAAGPRPLPTCLPARLGRAPAQGARRGRGDGRLGGFVLYLFATVVPDVVTEDSHLLIAAAILLIPGCTDGDRHDARRAGRRRLVVADGSDG